MAQNLNYKIITDEFGDDVFVIDTKRKDVYVKFSGGCLTLWNNDTEQTGKVHVCWDDHFIKTLKHLLKGKIAYGISGKAFE